MSAWTTVACLLRLRAEFNLIAPVRDTGADGTIGDAAHSPSSDHSPDEDSAVLRDHDADGKNEVHALDIDADLRRPSLTMERAVQHILALCRAGDRRLTYIIFNRRIWRAKNGWRQEAYTGDNPHTDHVHFSASYLTSQEGRTDTWHLEELVVTAPTPQQNADAVTGKDIDPGAGTYSLGGAVWTTLSRTAVLNSLPGDIQALKDDLDARVQDVDDELDGLGASLVFLSALIGQITNEPGIDPNVWYDIALAAARQARDEAPAGSSTTAAKAARAPKADNRPATGVK